MLAVCRVKEGFEEAQLVVAADERSLQGLAPVPATPFGDDTEGAPSRYRAGFALEELLTRFLEGDRLAGGPLCRLADEDRPRWGDRLETAGGVDEIARDHPLVRRAQRDGSFAGQDAGSRLDGWTERPDGIHELETSPDGPLGVIFVSGGGAPDRHHSIADELLN